MAFSCSGRLRRTSRIGPSTSTSISRRQVVARSCGQSQDAAGDEVALDLRRAAHDALGPAVEVHLQPGVVAAAVAGAAHRQRGVADRLLDLGHQQLVDRALGAVLDAVEAVGESPADVQPQHLGLDDRPAEVADLLGSEPRRLGAHDRPVSSLTSLR